MRSVGRSWAAVLAAVVVIVTGLVLGSAGPAAASSTPKFATYEGDCFPTDGSTPPELALVTKKPGSEGPLLPLFISGNRILIPHVAHYNLLGGIGGLKSRHNSYNGVPISKPGPVPAHSTTCEFTGQVVDEGELIGFTATVIGVMHGGKGKGHHV